MPRNHACHELLPFTTVLATSLIASLQMGKVYRRSATYQADSITPAFQMSSSRMTLRSNQMNFYAIRDMPRGKEVCSGYEKNVLEIATRRKQKLQMYYAFVCRYEACEGENKNEFSGRSDERRAAMLNEFKLVQTCEKMFHKEIFENDDAHNQERDQVVEEAISALNMLEKLLLKQGLTGVVLGNIPKLVEVVRKKTAARRGSEMEGDGTA
jgi:hypothetical protein